VALPEEPDASAWTVKVISMRPLYPMVAFRWAKSAQASRHRF